MIQIKRINKYAIGINASDTVLDMQRKKERVKDRVREIKRFKKEKKIFVIDFVMSQEMTTFKGI